MTFMAKKQGKQTVNTSTKERKQKNAKFVLYRIIKNWAVPQSRRDSCCVLYVCQCYYFLFTLNNDEYLPSISPNPQDVMYVMWVTYGLRSNSVS